MFFLFSLLALEFIATDENVQELSDLSKTVPVFMLFHSPYCPHCKKILPLWNLLGKQYFNEENVVIAQINCVENKKAAEHFINVKSYPTFGLIQNSTTSVVFVERTWEEWTKFIDRLKTFGKNYRCKIWLSQAGNYPSFVYKSPKNPEETCDDIQEILKQVPGAKDRIYADPNYNDTACQVNLHNEYGFLYEKQKNYSNFIPFIRDFLHQPLGDWEISDIVNSMRRLAFVIYDDPKHIKAFTDISLNMSIDYLFGKLKYEEFIKMYPTIELERSELPALGVTNYYNTRFMIMTNVKVNDHLYNRLTALNNITVNETMKYSMAKLFKVSEEEMFGKAAPKDISYFELIIIVVGSITILAVLVLLVVNFTRKGDSRIRNRILITSFNNMKAYFSSLCNKNGSYQQKTPVSFL
ncbi:hypothetical protein TRFO_16699 [Tritrichomonas foetus]|uniref:Thioredoxin domain-containing protein n=1 Tax=Tritrichomonas foetus TaxID=1144522 RepID=A0A1J4KPL5_9EUKA|nr:hypothetical protein TRFO_16699 [Tritrichomonas foetus]|eukprot:OHT13249.1 hypothetical protein TRFO_16699 [Tritrichomonas foetus]